MAYVEILGVIKELIQEKNRVKMRIQRTQDVQENWIQPAQLDGQECSDRRLYMPFASRHSAPRVFTDCFDIKCSRNYFDPWQDEKNAADEITCQ